MVDNLSPEMRSWNMSQIRCKDTKPEKILRSLLHNKGYRFRLHSKNLPGKPDIVLRKYKTVIFVHGCFWHRHVGCKFAYTPKTRVDFWSKKFERNIQRHNKVEQKLKDLGWKVFVIWECEIKDHDKIADRIKNIFSNNSYLQYRDLDCIQK